MPRQPRLLLSKSYYHVITRGNNRHKVFVSNNDYLYYLHLLDRFKTELPFDLFHYCLMPNHVHLLVRTHNSQDFSTFMKKINLAYFHHYRRYYDWVGHFWQDRYRSQPVGKDQYFIQCGKYIELNPVRAKLVKRPEDYKFSSYKYYSEGKKNNLITLDIFYNEFGNNDPERQTRYRKLIINSIIVKNYKKPVWGTSYQREHEIKKIRYNLEKKANNIS